MKYPSLAILYLIFLFQAPALCGQPAGARQLYWEAMQNMAETGQYATSVAKLRKAEATDTANSETYHTAIALLYYTAQQYEQAIEVLRPYLDIDTGFSYTHPYFHLCAMAMTASGREEEASNIMRIWIKMRDSIQRVNPPEPISERRIINKLTNDVSWGTYIVRPEETGSPHPLIWYTMAMQFDPYNAEVYRKISEHFLRVEENAWALFFHELYAATVSEAAGDSISTEINNIYSHIVLKNFWGKARFYLFRRLPIGHAQTPDPTQVYITPFTFVYRAAALGEAHLLTDERGRPINRISAFHRWRKGILDTWYAKNNNEMYPFPLMSYHKSLQQAGLFEAYNYWLLRTRDEKEFSGWYNRHKEEYQRFLEWRKSNALKLDETDLNTLINAYSQIL